MNQATTVVMPVDVESWVPVAAPFKKLLSGSTFNPEAEKLSAFITAYYAEAELEAAGTSYIGWREGDVFVSSDGMLVVTAAPTKHLSGQVSIPARREEAAAIVWRAGAVGGGCWRLPHSVESLWGPGSTQMYLVFSGVYPNPGKIYYITDDGPKEVVASITESATISPNNKNAVLSIGKEVVAAIISPSGVKPLERLTGHNGLVWFQNGSIWSRDGSEVFLPPNLLVTFKDEQVNVEIVNDRFKAVGDVPSGLFWKVEDLAQHSSRTYSLTTEAGKLATLARPLSLGTRRSLVSVAPDGRQVVWRQATGPFRLKIIPGDWGEYCYGRLDDDGKLIESSEIKLKASFAGWVKGALDPK